MNIRTLIFDNNGILTTSDAEATLANVSRFLNTPISILKPAWEKIGQPLDEGKITTDEFHKELLKALDLEENLEDLKKVHFESYLPKSNVRNFVLKLGSLHELALLTNFGDAFDECNKKWKLDKIFDPKKMFVSYKLGVRKPHQDIYLYALDKLSKLPKETIFIDDRKENLIPADRLGMNTILFKNLEQLKQDLKKYITI